MNKRVRFELSVLLKSAPYSTVILILDRELGMVRVVFFATGVNNLPDLNY